MDIFKKHLKERIQSRLKNLGIWNETELELSDTGMHDMSMTWFAEYL